jgi:Cytochrome P450
MPYTKNGLLPAIFTTQDEKQHKQLKTPIASLYSLTNVVTFEEFVDDVLGILFQEFDKRYAGSQKPFDLGDWLQYFAFDVMGTMTFSSRYGFLETGTDVGGMLQAIWKFMLGVAPVSPRYIYIYTSFAPFFSSFICTIAFGFPPIYIIQSFEHQSLIKDL